MPYLSGPTAEAEVAAATGAWRVAGAVVRAVATEVVATEEEGASAGATAEDRGEGIARTARPRWPTPRSAGAVASVAKTTASVIAAEIVVVIALAIAVEIDSVIVVVIDSVAVAALAVIAEPLLSARST